VGSSVVFRKDIFALCVSQAMAATSFGPRAGWIQWRDLALDAEWVRCWCIVSRDAIQLMEHEESEMLLDEYEITRATCACLMNEKDVPMSMVGMLAGKPFGFALCNAVGDRSACFEAECAEDLATWTDAINEAAAVPRELEAYIDDFSDVEDDEHARRCSLDALDATDWAQVAASMSPTGAHQSDIGVKKVVSVTAVRLDEHDELFDAARRSSLEAVLDMDWAGIGIGESLPLAEEADGGTVMTPRSTTAESEEGDDAADDDVIAEAWKIEEKAATEQTEPCDFEPGNESFDEGSGSEKSLFDEVYGECW